MPVITNGFDWTSRQGDLNTLVKETSKEIWISRPIFKLWGQPDTPVYAHKVTSEPSPTGLGSSLSVKPRDIKQPVQLSCQFGLFPDQYDDDEAIHTLAVEAAYRVAQAEDAVLLLGSGAAGFLKDLGVEARNLNDQSGLFDKVPQQVPKTKSILDSILQGIKELQKKGRFGKYVAIVSLDLYQEAFKPRTNAIDAQIYEIRPLLMDKGFLWGQAAPDQTGVIMSLNGDGIKLAVPMEVCVTLDTTSHNVQFLQVLEQIRLLVDVPDAVVQLA